MRSRFSFAACDLDAVQHWARWYTRHPDTFSRQLAGALPRLRYVDGILASADIPAEFALLPWVESNFRPLRARGAGAGGLWQIMPPTGRELGLRIDSRYDGRLSLDESTRAVARMLTRDHKLLGDWRLTDMAYNAGVYRIRRLLQNNPAAATSADLQQLSLPRVTRDHLAKLQALACIVRTPQAWDVRLPDPEAGQRLVLRPLPKALELPVAARLSGLSTEQIRDLNAAILDPEVPAHALLLPTTSAPRFDLGYSALRRFGWQQWQYVRVNASVTLQHLAGDHNGRGAMLAMVNKQGRHATLPAQTRLWLPVTVVSALPSDIKVAAANAPPSRYTVQAGDSLWSIARRFDLDITHIKTWNNLRGSLLRLGQVLVLHP